MSNFTRTNYSGCLITDNLQEYYAFFGGKLPDYVRHTWIILSVVNSIAAPLTVAINLLIIWTVVKDESLRMVNYNILIAALAVTDLTVGLLVEPLFAVLLVCRVVGCSSCIYSAYAIILILCTGCTLIIFMVLSVERYLAIQHTQFYLENVTTKKILLTTAFNCLVVLPAIFLATVLLDDYKYLKNIPTVVGVGWSNIIILYCSIRVQLTAYRQRRAINTQAATVQLQQAEHEQQQRRLQEYKRVFTMGVLLVASILLYCPYIINTILLATNGRDFSNFISTPGFVPTCAHLQSLLNPIIVSLRLSYIRTIREGVKNKLCCRE